MGPNSLTIVAWQKTCKQNKKRVFFGGAVRQVQSACFIHTNEKKVFADACFLMGLSNQIAMSVQ